MSEGIALTLFFVTLGAIYFVVRFVGNKIIDKSSDAIRNSRNHRKNAEQKQENLADRYRK